MSEEIQKVYKITKVGASDVYFILSPISNPNAKRVINLTTERPSQMLPLDWALGVIQDQGTYTMFKLGYFTFDKVDDLAKEAQKAGVWFDEVFDFTPVNPEDDKLILDVLKFGQRTKINEYIEKYGNDRVRDIAIANKGILSVNVVKMLEDIFKLQFTVDGE